MGNVFSAMLAGVFVAFALTIGGQVEGYIAPVAGNTSIEAIEEVGATHTRIRGRSKKRRECEYVRLEFRTAYGTVAPVIFEEGTNDRGEGRFTFGPWLVQMSSEQIETARVVTYHRCHPLWLTETRWYP